MPAPVNATNRILDRRIAEALRVVPATSCGEHNDEEVRGETTHCVVCGVRVWS